MALAERLAEARRQFEQAKATANFYAGQVALLESLLEEDSSDSVNTKLNGPGDGTSEPRA